MACRIEKNLEFESVEIEGEKIPEVIIGFHPGLSSGISIEFIVLAAIQTLDFRLQTPDSSITGFGALERFVTPTPIFYVSLLLF